MKTVKKIKLDELDIFRSRVFNEINKKSIHYTSFCRNKDISESIMCKFKIHNCNPNLKFAVNIAEELNCNIDYLLGFVNKKKKLNNINANNFADNLIREIENRQIKISSLAKECEISLSAMYKYKNRENIPNITNAVKIAKRLNVTVGYMLM